MSACPLAEALNQHLGTLLTEARIEVQVLQQCPEIHLYLINADFPRGPLSSDSMVRLMDEPPYWAFCWASGQVLARYLLDNPRWVRGRYVLDFGAGSGVVGIAAAMAGARRVVCCDNDPMACESIAANASLNGVELEIVQCLPGDRPDLMVLADVLYDRDNIPLVESLLGCAPDLLLADSRVRDLCLPHFEAIGSYGSCTWPDLDESEEFNSVRLYHGRRDGGLIDA